MRALFGERWIEGVPDYHRRPHEYRVRVLALCNLERLDGLYAVRKRDLRVVWNYAREIGLRDTLRKVASRTSERFRNAKYVSCGLGRIVEASDRGSYPVGQAVVFVCPIGPACAERLVLPEELLLPIEASSLPALPERSILLREAPEQPEAPWWQALRGWSPHSGQRLPVFDAAAALKEAQRLLLKADWTSGRRLPSTGEPACGVARGAPSSEAFDRKRAILFGYGNYAKTIILPRIGAHLRVDRIHEIDPTQIPLRRRGEVDWDTSPELEPQERADAVLIAGHHHTHAPLACEALRRGAAVVVEKPIATTRAQLHDLLAALRETGGALFAGYQRRHLPFNALAYRDLGVDRGEPVSYHAIVYEVPLPALHWYRWPNSRSRLVSNGCHWLDHFLHLNDYCAVDDYDVTAASDGTVNCSVSLENGAFFTMVLTDRGSRRLGVQDYVELRANGVTARIVNASRYEAEDEHRILRRQRINRLDAYRIMYDSIGRRIAAGEPGDSLLSIQRSSALVLDLEDRLSRLLRAPRVDASLPLVPGLAAATTRTVATAA